MRSSTPRAGLASSPLARDAIALTRSSSTMRLDLRRAAGANASPFPGVRRRHDLRARAAFHLGARRRPPRVQRSASGRSVPGGQSHDRMLE